MIYCKGKVRKVIRQEEIRRELEKTYHPRNAQIMASAIYSVMVANDLSLEELIEMATNEPTQAFNLFMKLGYCARTARLSIKALNTLAGRKVSVHLLNGKESLEVVLKWM